MLEVHFNNPDLRSGKVQNIRFMLNQVLLSIEYLPKSPGTHSCSVEAFRVPDVLDSSGVQIHYTDRLRQYDIGIIEVGLEYTDKMAIPPGQTGFDLKGYCISECTRAVRLPKIPCKFIS